MAMRFATLCALLLLPAAAMASDPVPPEGGDPPTPLPPLPEAVEELFAETEDGVPVVPHAAQSYFAQLPAHAQNLFVDALDEGIISGAVHAGALLSMELPTDAMELLLRDNCILCHTDADMHDEETLWRLESEGEGSTHMVLRDFLSDVHFRQGLSCAGCHGGAPSDTDMADEIYERWPSAPERHEDRTWVPDFCSRCHADPSFMRGFNPGLPTDQYAKYRESQHGILLLGEGDSKAAQCVSCHGIHGIRESNSRRSMTHPQNIPATCGQCHADPEYMAGYTTLDGRPLPTDQVEQYRVSVHGVALLERGDLGAPACNDCHGNHAAMPPEVSLVSQVCRTCHSGNGSLFDGSQHKKAFAENGWPECGRCHGEHDIVKPSDAMMAVEAGRLCYDCHAEYSRNNPECNEVAAHFHEMLTTLSEHEETFEEEVEILAAKGLDVEVLGSSLTELSDALRQSRSAIHSFDRSDFDEVAQAGLDAIQTGETSITDARAEFGFRRNGLLASIAVMAFLALVLYLKIRQIERRA